MTRKIGRGIPESFRQVEVENCKDKIKVRGTIKAAVIEGYVGCQNLFIYSIYDTKPVHCLAC